MRLLHLFLLLCLSLSTVSAQTNESGEDAPWLDIGIEHRTRYETLDNRFRLGETGGDQQLPQRTRFRMEVKRITDPFGIVMEFEDARVHMNDFGSTVKNTMENENDILQLYLNFSAGHPGGSKPSSNIYIGRQTMDLGSRRLVARNKFRNTTNSFDAVRWVLGNEKSWQLTTFLSRPVLRRMHQPDMPDHTGAFWGAFLSAKFTPHFSNEFYYFGLRESMTSPESSKRQYSTVGTRFYKNPQMGRVSYEFETALQFGKKGSLDHLAHFEHISADYTLNIPWRPKLTGRYDYASGTGNPTGQEDGSFYTLYGARRFEFGPTGIFGAFARANLSSPGLAVELKPSKSTAFYSSMRWFWLASARDQWAGTKLKDPTGNSGSYLGSQMEFRLRYNAGRYFRPEIGYARLLKGSYLSRVPLSPDTPDSNYFYVQTSFVFDHFFQAY